MKHLFAVGAVYLDTILSVPHYPEEDSKLRASNVQVRRGGNVSNSLEVLAQLVTLAPGEALQLHLLSPLPQRDSPAVKSIRSSFGPDESVVDVDQSFHRPGHHQPASSYIIRCGDTGSRTIVNYNDLPEMTLDEFVGVVNNLKAGGLTGAEETWWHFEGRIPDISLRCIHYLRKALPAARVSIEAEKPGREGLRELAAEADVVFYSRAYAESTGVRRDMLQSFLVQQAQETARRAFLLLLTCGADGAYALSRTSEKYDPLLCPVQASGRAINVVE